MEEGKFLLRYSAKVRALFSPAELAETEGFVEKYLPASSFDARLRPGQIEVLPWRIGGHSAAPAWRCAECRLTLVQESP
jgi:hypothetical protein